MLDVVTLGETMVLFVPTRTGLLRYAHQFERYLAGAESNTAIGLSRLGHRTGWISRVGNDEFGEYILAFLRGEQVDVSQVIRTQEAPTGVFFKERRSTGSTRVFYYREGSAASQMTAQDISETYILNARYLHLTGITAALSPTCLSTLLAAIEIAKSGNGSISFDPNIRLKLWNHEKAKKTLLSIIPHVDILLISNEEAALLTELKKPTEAARNLLSMGPEQVIIKMGKQGAIGLTRDQEIRVPSINVNVVETVGAGDAFNAGYLSGQLRNWDLKKSLQLGNVMGGLATTTPGDVEGLPDWAEIQFYLGGEQIIER